MVELGRDEGEPLYVHTYVEAQVGVAQAECSAVASPTNQAEDCMESY